MKINVNVRLFSETFQAMPIKFAVKTVRLESLYNSFSFSQSDDCDLALHSRSQLRLKRDNILTCTIIVISLALFFLSHDIQTWKDGTLISWHNYTDVRFDDLDLDARSQWVGRGKQSALNYIEN